MTTLGPSPFVWLPFDEGANIRTDWSSDALADLKSAVAAPGITDLVVLSHGWQNDLRDAETLYGTLWGHVCTELGQRGVDPARIVVAGVLWPSKKWDADYDGGHALDMQPSVAGALGLGDEGSLPAHAEDIEQARFEAYLDTLRDLVGHENASDMLVAARAQANAPSPENAVAMFETAKNALGWDKPDHAPDAELKAEANWSLGTEDPALAERRFISLAMQIAVPVDPSVGATLGLGDAIGSVWRGARNGTLWALNKLTYYTMKKRAGAVGEALAEHVLGQLAGTTGLRIHLVGHSFGGRLVTAAATALRAPAGVELGAVVLLQAAYSHNGLTPGIGAFAGLLSNRPKGPIVFTHTHNDLACTFAYPLASRVVGDTALSLGDANDPFGAMGANGPQGLKANQIIVCNPAKPALHAGLVNTVLADAFVTKTAVSDAHNNVTNAGCGALVAAAICRH
ncbi:hypothetical protein [Sphingomonas sp. R3G8C]|uniref:hypothetical protein n=1 Tax=Novosphingobium rhizosphaerae TaxID=1551649 RepID=UPI0015CE31DF